MILCSKSNKTLVLLELIHSGSILFYEKILTLQQQKRLAQKDTGENDNQVIALDE